VGTAANASPQLSFEAPSRAGEEGIVVVSYTVTSVPTGASYPVVIDPQSPQQTYTATGLINGVCYSFSVTATNSAGITSSVQQQRRGWSDGIEMAIMK